MSKYFDIGYSVGATKSLQIPDTNISSEMLLKAQAPADVTYVNKSTPIDRPETVRYWNFEVKDVYASTGIDPVFMSPSHKGIRTNVLVRSVGAIKDDDPACCASETYLPVSASLSLQVPYNAIISQADLLAVVTRAVSCMFNAGDVTGAKIEELIRGALTT